MIHRYQKKGLNFVLDVNSGAVHLLDDISYAVSGLLDENMGDTCPQSIIDALSNYTADEIREAYDELYELKKAGQLFAQDDYIDVSRYIPVNAPVKALCLHVAHDCNLRCQYCFASTGDFGQGFDLDNAPYSNMVLGEVVNLPGKWSCGRTAQVHCLHRKSRSLPSRLPAGDYGDRSHAAPRHLARGAGHIYADRAENAFKF